MDIVFFIIWGICTLWCFLIIPIGNKIEKLDDILCEKLLIPSEIILEIDLFA